MNGQGKLNPNKREVSAITVYIPKSDQASIPGEYEIHTIFTTLVYLAQRARNGTGLKNRLKQNT